MCACCFCLGCFLDVMIGCALAKILSIRPCSRVADPQTFTTRASGVFVTCVVRIVCELYDIFFFISEDELFSNFPNRIYSNSFFKRLSKLSSLFQLHSQQCFLCTKPTVNASHVDCGCHWLSELLTIAHNFYSVSHTASFSWPLSETVHS